MMDKDGSPLHNLQSVSDVKIVYDNYMDQVYVARTLNLSLSVNISSQVAHGYSKCQKASKLCNILVFEMRKLHFLKIPFGFDFKFNYSDKYECNGGQNYEKFHVRTFVSVGCCSRQA